MFSMILRVRYSLYAGVELQPLAAFTGGVLAQEVVKCTGEQVAIKKVFCLIIPNSNNLLSMSNFVSRLSRHIIAHHDYIA